MRFSVDPSLALPVYRQLMAQLMDAVAGGALRPRERLPSHRELSKQLVIAPLTVKKAYDELERAGYLEQVRGSGTFVAATPPKCSRAEAFERLKPLAKQLVVQAALLGVSEAGLSALVKEEFNRIGEAAVASKRNKEKIR